MSAHEEAMLWMAAVQVKLLEQIAHQTARHMGDARDVQRIMESFETEMVSLVLPDRVESLLKGDCDSAV